MAWLLFDARWGELPKKCIDAKSELNQTTSALIVEFAETFDAMCDSDLAYLNDFKSSSTVLLCPVTNSLLNMGRDDTDVQLVTTRSLRLWRRNLLSVLTLISATKGKGIKKFVKAEWDNALKELRH
jgi:hypothetical protein